jgi:hypothetical protein
VEAFLAFLAVVAQVRNRVVGQQPHGPFGVGVIRDMDPQGGAALAGAVEVALEAVGSTVTAVTTCRARLRWARYRSWSSRICWLV